MSMIELTPVAAEKLREIRGSQPSRAYLRVWVAGRTCSGYQYGLAFDDNTEDKDTVSEVSGIPLAVDAVSQPYCEGATIDYVNTPEGEGFIVRNATITAEGGGCGGGCSCGH
jgi:iron-sulfur cluster insertion protein